MASIARCHQGSALYVRGRPACRKLMSPSFGFAMHLSNCAGAMFIRYSVVQLCPDSLRECVHVNRFRIADGPEVHAMLMPVNNRVAIG
jgi:hypothetical protein